jgi:transposase
VINFDTSRSIRRGELVSARRRRWTIEEKQRIVAESFLNGTCASDIARRHDISPQQLFQWRREAKLRSLVRPCQVEDFPFAEVQIEGFERVAEAREGLVLELGAARIRIDIKTDLDLLAHVVRAVGTVLG